MTDTSNENARELLDVLYAQGVRTYFVSPGSRNTPLLIGLSARDELHKYIIADERMAAFAALGYSLVSREPVALVCTSGTAMYNYAPAIAEAFYQHVPLIVITADRPAQWINQDDSQTLRQADALEKIVKRSFNIHPDAGALSGCASSLFDSEKEWYVNRIANEAVLTALSGIPGPVHINMQFANPLQGVCERIRRNPRIISVVHNEGKVSKNDLGLIANRLVGRKVLVVAGFMPPDHRLNKALGRFSSLPNVTVMCETISNVHLPGDAYMVDTLLARLDEAELQSLVPDVVITLGGALVSRMLKEFLRRNEVSEHWTLGDTAVATDCMQRLSLHIEADPSYFFSGLYGAMRKRQVADTPVDYRDRIAALRVKARTQADSFIAAAPWSELTALHRVFECIPDSYNVVLSNGTCVRYAQLLMQHLPHLCICNRGVSGIEGTNATAFGASLAYRGTTLLITGDMSFSYCPEIMDYRKLGGDLRIILINNSGGGIFRFIPTTRNLSIREEYFCADSEMPISAIAKAYGWHYMEARDDRQLNQGIEFLKTTSNSLIEIKVNKDQSAQTLINFLG